MDTIVKFLFKASVSPLQLIFMAIGTYLLNEHFDTISIPILLIFIAFLSIILNLIDEYKNICITTLNKLYLNLKNKFVKPNSFIIIEDTKFYINDTIWFKKPIIHPATNEKIINGKIIYINNDIVSIYLADKTDFKDGYCESWIKSFSIEEIQKNCKI